MTVISSTKDDLFNLDLIRSYVDKELNPRFVERHWLKKQIEDKLVNPDCRFLLLTAEPGAGKSAFMAWLAHQHPNWCRYFIRRDQRTPLGDVGSYSFLRQVGFQLAATYPDLFKQEQIKIVVEQRIGTATNSEIVGAEIAKMFASPFYEKIIQIQQQVTHSKETNIRGVRVGELYATERDLPVENLQFMALFDPAKAMMKQVQQTINGSQSQIVVLVDALDELRYQDSQLSLLKWLTNCPELPANLRFVLTSRPDDDLLRAFRGTQEGRIQEISIAEEGPEVIQDLTRYVRFLIETPEVNQTLSEMHQNLDKFTDQAITKANGNFGYLGAIGRAVDEAIRQKHSDLLKAALDLSQLPNNLQDLYAFFLTKIKSAVNNLTIKVTDPQTENKYFLEVWSEIYQPILGILSVANEPLTIEQIQKFGDIPGERKHLVAAIDRLRQFLDKLENCYRLYHSTLPEFFTSSETQRKYDYCYVDSVVQNRSIVNYYQSGARTWAEVNLEKIAKDDYGRRHLAQHLVKSNRVEDLHTLLSLEKDGKNAWFDAKNNLTEYLADLTLAWQIVEKEFSTSQSSEFPKLLALQCRYALIQSSINNLTFNLPTQLIVELLKKGSARGLAYFRQQILTQQLQEPDLQILSTLQHQDLQDELLEKLFGAIEELRDRNYQTLVKSALVQLSPHLLSNVLEAAKALENEKVRVQALSLLIPHLSPKQCSELLEIAGLIKQDEDKKNLLTLLAPSVLDEMLPKVLKMSRELKGQHRADVLIALAPRLVIELLPEALEVALEILSSNEYEYALTRALSGLAGAPGLTEDLIEKIQQQAEAFQNKNYTTHVMSALIPHLSLEQQDKILQQIQVMNDENHEAQILSALASGLPENQQAKILDIVYTIKDRQPQVKALSEVASYLPLDLLYKVLENLQVIEEDEYYKAEVLSVLVGRLPSDQLHKILQEVQTIREENNKASVLIGLCTASGLTIELIEKIKEQAELFKDKNNKALIFSNLSRYLSGETVDKLALKLQTIDDNYNQTKTIISLLSYLDIPISQLSDILQKLTVLEELQAIEKEDYKALSIKDLVSCLRLPLSQLHNIFREVQRIHAQSDKATALSQLATAPNLSVDLAEKIQEETNLFQNKNHRIQVLSKLAKYLSEQLLQEVLETTKAIENWQERAEALSALALSLPPNQLHHELQDLLAIGDKYEYAKAEILKTLACRLPSDQLQNIIQELEAIDDNYYKVQVLSELAPHLLSDQLHEQLHKNYRNQVLEALKHLSDEPSKIVQKLETIEDENYKALVLRALLPLCSPEELQEILKVARAINNEFYRADILRVLAPQLVKVSRDDLHCLWNETLHILASRSRRQLLSDFRELTPVIFSLGKDEAVVEVCDAICDAIKDIGRQWR